VPVEKITEPPPEAEWKFFPKFVALMSVALLSGYGTWFLTSEHYQSIIENMQTDAQRASNAELMRMQQISAISAKRCDQRNIASLAANGRE